MKRREFFIKVGWIGALSTSPIALFSRSLVKEREESEDMDVPLNLPTIGELRKLSMAIPGELPNKIHVTKVADTIRPANIVVEGESKDKKITLARTVYQLVYPQGNIMIDSGMDLETHRSFGKSIEPYYPQNYKMVQTALKKANLIVISHYHADHSAGVIRYPDFDAIAGKVWVSKETAGLMVNHPHKPTTKISAERVDQFLVTDMPNCYPIAPGFVVFKAPGHTPDSKMFYVKTADGKEFIHSVDSGWSMENIIKEKMKNASWVKENKSQLMKQYHWLNHLLDTEKNITILCTHDNVQYQQLTENGVLGKGLKI